MMTKDMTTTTRYWIHLNPVLMIIILTLLATTRILGASRPNVIVIMADDIDAEGLGCYGSTIYTTPNLDRMALMSTV